MAAMAELAQNVQQTVVIVEYSVLRRIRRQHRTRLLGSSRVEERRGDASAPRFPSPLIKLDVPVSGIQLSDWFHLATVGSGPR
jgi:hypothetical protein